MNSPAPDSSLPTSSWPRRLRAGHHLFLAEDGGWLLLQPDGVFVRLHLPATRVAAVADHLLAPEPAEEAEPAVAELLAIFAERGLLAPAGGPAAILPQRRNIAIDGEGPVAAALFPLLAAEGLLPVALDPRGELPSGLSLIASCAGWLPDLHWQAIAASCRERGIAWHGCHAEGERFYLGPCWLPGHPLTASYPDVRARRLAAEMHPDGLEAYWRYAEKGPTPPVPWPGAGAIAMLAGAMAADIAAWARGEDPPSLGFQLAFDAARLDWRRHPVLPVPRGLLTETAP